MSPSEHNDSTASVGHANLLLEQGKLEESEAEFKTLLTGSGNKAEAFYGLGVIQFKRGDYSGALALFQNCLRLDPENANAYYFVGESWEKMNMPDAAAAFFTRALAINPKHYGARQALSRREGHNFTDGPADVRTHQPVQPATADYSTAATRPPNTGGPSPGTVVADGAGIYEYLSTDKSGLAGCGKMHAK